MTHDQDIYPRHREAARARQERIAASGRDIGPIPPVEPADVAIPSYLADRETFDEWRASTLRSGLAALGQLDRFDEIIARQYPVALDQMLRELHFRGFDAEQLIGLALAWERHPDFPRIGDVPVWYPVDIDRFAGTCLSAGRLTPAARRRQRRGISWEDQRHGQ